MDWLGEVNRLVPVGILITLIIGVMRTGDHLKGIRSDIERQTKQLADHSDKMAANAETQAEKRMRQPIEFLTLAFIRDDQPKQRQRGG